MRAGNGPESHSNVGVRTGPLVCIRDNKELLSPGM